MYDSDGSGFFALGILMMFGALALGKFILENLLWFIVAFIILVIIAYLWIIYGYDIQKKFKDWYVKNIRAFLHIFGIELYNRHVWNIFCIIDWIIRCFLRFGSLIAVLWIIGFILSKV